MARMDKSVRAELRFNRWDGLREETQTSVISCEAREVELDRGGRHWCARGVPPNGIPEFTAWSGYVHAATLAVFAKWLGVVQSLRDALDDIEREAWNKDGRARFRRALGTLLDKIDSRYAHDVSEASKVSDCRNDAIDTLWHVGCIVLHIGYKGCAINTEGDALFLIDEWVGRAELDIRYPSDMQSPAAQSIARQLWELAERTR